MSLAPRKHILPFGTHMSETAPPTKRTKTMSLETTPEHATLCVNTIRTLAADVVQKANSGHPGA